MGDEGLLLLLLLEVARAETAEAVSSLGLGRIHEGGAVDVTARLAATFHDADVVLDRGLLVRLLLALLGIVLSFQGLGLAMGPPSAAVAVDADLSSWW